MRLPGTTHGATGPRARGGFALVVVLLVLLSLLVLATPFLLMARTADQASAQLADRVDARVALDTAARHGRLLLEASHPSLDKTPYFDGLDELAVDNAFDPSFYDADDARGVMWDLDARDLAGRIDLNSAGPFVLANMIGAATRLSEAAAEDAEELRAASVSGFEPAGFLWIEGELVRYGALEDNAFGDLTRGLLARRNADGEWMDGPQPPLEHGLGAPVLDQRAFGPVDWRTRGAPGELRTFEAAEELVLARDSMLKTAAGESGLAEDAIQAWRRLGTVHAAVRGGRTWQRAARLVAEVRGGVDGRLRLDSTRWINPGATVRVDDGTVAELAVVQAIGADGSVLLDRVLDHGYEAYAAEVRVLARRPVNANTAPPDVLEALFANLQLQGRNARITLREAQELAALVVESRPFTGHEDFLRRVVLPAAGLEKLPSDAPVVPESLAAGRGLIDADDALALYANALNANDGYLLVSTMPLCFTSRDVFELDLRTAIHARSGVERTSAVRETVELVVPQRELLALWARQEDFDEAFRVDCEAPWWMSGPSATSRYDLGAAPPSRLAAHFGSYPELPPLSGVTEELAAGVEEPETPEHVFASREEDGWAQLWPSRVAETQRLEGRVLHFDHETRDPEGRYLPDEPVRLATDDKLVAWTDPNAVLLRPLFVSLWVRPRQADGLLFDLGGSDLESDRVSLLTEQGDLVLRVLDGTGDHRDTTFAEAGELRFALAAGQDPGLPLDTWSHVAIDLRGNRPDQMTMLVNGLAHGVRTPGLTRLSSSVGETDAVLPVESTEGFPPECVVRVGDELVECTVDGQGALRAEHSYTGARAGYGGRNARVRFDAQGEPAELPDLVHEPGVPVALYGYSLPLQGQGVPAGRADLPSELGPFRAAEAVGVLAGGQQGGEAIIIEGLLAQALGMEGAQSQATALLLQSADDPSVPPEEFMSAFDRNGGYAAILQVSFGTAPTTVQGTPIGGVEVIRYSGWDVDGSSGVLRIAARGNAVGSELPNYAGAQGPDIGGARAFVTDWGNIGVNTVTGFVDLDTVPQASPFVVPISIPVPGATGLQGFLHAEAGASEFAQITHVDDVELTEWVRYDWFQESLGFLVRDDPGALLSAQREATGSSGPPTLRDPPGGPGGPGDPGGGDGGGGGAALFLAAAPEPAAAARRPARQAGYDEPSFWVPTIGERDPGELESFPRSQAFGDALQFRGVLGTYWHTHPAGTPVLPVFSTSGSGPDVGVPGRLDHAFLVASTPDHIGWPVTVHRGHKPSANVAVQRWDYAGQALVPDEVEQTGFDRQWIRVALQDRAPEPIPAGTAGGPGTGLDDSRLLGRLTLFPSGERPRVVAQTTIGGAFDGSAASIPAAVVDEIVFGNAEFGNGTPNPEATAGGQMILASACSELDDELELGPELRLAGMIVLKLPPFLDECPPDAGLLRIGNEILAYDSRDASTGRITVAPDGRGLLGTRPQAHEAREPVTFLEHLPVSALPADIGPGDHRIPLKDLTDFPAQGTVLIGDELVHYTALHEGGLWMPARSAEPGRMDGRGEGLFRGRFGTLPAGHTAGECVILFPFRYWDRWAERADAPELAYLGLAIDQPAAFWRSMFWTAEEASGAARVGVLQRTDPDVPWDADPEQSAGLELLWTGTRAGAPIPIGEQSDRIEWRVLVQYQPDAFDAATGLAHGWKETPRLRNLGAFYLGPGLTLASLDR